MKKFLMNCWDFISSLFVLFVFCVCIVVTFAVCYTFPNIAIVAGVAAIAVTIISKLTSKKEK